MYSTRTVEGNKTMDPRSPSFEANLLFKTAPRFTLSSVVNKLRCAIEDQGETLHHVEKIDTVFTHLTCDSVDILLAYCEAPLPAEHFLGAERPSVTSFSDAEILTRLTLNQASFTILVTDREIDDMPYGAAHEALKRALCWDLADCIESSFGTDLVFWSDTDTLYASEEFARACTYAESQTATQPYDEDCDQLPTVAELFHSEPVVNGAALAWLNGQVEESRNDVALSDQADIEDAKHPSIFGQMAHRIQDQLSPHRALNGAAMTCASTTIGLTSLPGITALLG